MQRYCTMSMFLSRFWLVGLYFVLAHSERTARAADDADLILHHGKIVTVDRDFSIREALAVKGDRLIRVGTNLDILSMRGPKTTLVDLAGKMVLPGLIDSHAHPTDACLPPALRPSDRVCRAGTDADGPRTTRGSRQPDRRRQ